MLVARYSVAGCSARPHGESRSNWNASAQSGTKYRYNHAFPYRTVCVFGWNWRNGIDRGMVGLVGLVVARARVFKFCYCVGLGWVGCARYDFGFGFGITTERQQFCRRHHKRNAMGSIRWNGREKRELGRPCSCVLSAFHIVVSYNISECRCGGPLLDYAAK